MHINLKIEKPALFPLQFKHCTVQFLAVVSGHRYFVQHGYWFGVFSIEMQELKLHEFWKNRIFKSVGDKLIANLVSMSAEDCPSNEYVIYKGLTNLWFTAC